MTSELCECGHKLCDHNYLTLKEIDACRANDIEHGTCIWGSIAPGKTPEGDWLYWTWFEFKEGQTYHDALKVFLDLPKTEDPCDTEFMRSISS